MRLAGGGGKARVGYFHWQHGRTERASLNQTELDESVMVFRCFTGGSINSAAGRFSDEQGGEENMVKPRLY